MTDRPADGAERDLRQNHGRIADARLTRALGRARWTLLWERLWPAIAAPVTVVGLFLAVSWLGVWLWLPPIGRAIGLFAFFLLTAAAFAPLLMVRRPGTSEVLRRLDRNTGLPHRPATALNDKIANNEADSVSLALWRAHLEQALRGAKSLRAGLPAPRLVARDPMALRALVLVLAVATYFAAGDERLRRVAAAFDWQGVMAPANFRVDAWVSPPTYTGRPPVLLAGLRPGEPVPQTATMEVPAGSTLVIRATGQVRLDIVTTGGLTEPKPEAKPVVAAGTDERRFTINEAGTVTLRGLGSSNLTWKFTAIPDRPPTIALTRDPEPQLRGAMKLTYKLEDDYGVIDAKATFALKAPANTKRAAPRALYEPPEIALVLPQARTKNGVGTTTKEVTEHPWAGADVVMTLVARDEANNEGKSEPFELRLPERPFSKPVARALIEQRRVLALDADAQAKVMTALDALTIAPEQFKIESNVYLGLRSIFWQLAHAKSDDDLRGVVDRLWDMAINLEDGNVSAMEQALRAAQEALRQALERGANDEELKKLMDQLREAMNKYMQALAEQLKRNPEQLNRPLDQNAKQIRPQDLKAMLDRLEKLARQGAKEAAKQLLAELQKMLENLQMAQPNGPMDGDMDDDMMSSLDQLGDMIRRQQELRDRTFREGQDQRRDRQRGQDRDPNNMKELEKNQQALQDQLKQLLEELKKRGFGQKPGQGDDNLGQAEKEMGTAKGRLGKGNPDGAVDSQGKALDALRRGAQSLAQAMQDQGLGPGPGPGNPGRLGRQRAQQDTDPLGRPLRGRDYGDDVTVKVPGEIDVQRARRILEELRRRFGEAFRPQLELDYIERLLRDY